MAARRKSREGEGFVLRDGSVVETKAQLAAAVKKMSDDDFGSFCNAVKNDFHVWLRECLDPVLADRIKDIRDRTALVAALKAK